MPQKLFPMIYKNKHPLPMLVTQVQILTIMLIIRKNPQINVHIFMETEKHNQLMMTVYVL